MALRTGGLGMAGKPWYYGLGIGLGIGGVLFGLGYWQYVGPIKDDIQAQESRLEDLQHKKQEGLIAQQQLPKFREEVHQLELELDKLLRILPARWNTPDLLRRIRALAEQGDFNLKDFKPGVLTDKEFYSEWPISVDLDGTYHNLALLFDRVGRFSRIINIQDLTINALNPTKSNPHTIAASFIAKTFVYKEPDANAPAPATAKPARPGLPQPPPGAPGAIPPPKAGLGDG
ncbi:MAG TPA: type 4a pilus biogenesis protein PilO [Thermoanaerobaculia bacterium]|nr:type 4a pilus biogenesis protein PilO [Thermoanaerobaculia bacterium]